MLLRNHGRTPYSEKSRLLGTMHLLGSLGYLTGSSLAWVPWLD